MHFAGGAEVPDAPTPAQSCLDGMSLVPAAEYSAVDRLVECLGPGVTNPPEQGLASITVRHQELRAVRLRRGRVDTVAIKLNLWQQGQRIEGILESWSNTAKTFPVVGNVDVDITLQLVL